MTGVLKRARDLFGSPGPAESKPETKPETKPESKPEAPKRPARPWHAVSIVPGHQPCAAAAGLARKRFLSREAPSLPLKDCDQEFCSCRYDHHNDRRKGPRRVSDMGVSVDGYEHLDKRSGPKRGRRKTDR